MVLPKVVAIVALSRDANSTNTKVTLPATFPLSDGTVLVDRLGGQSVTVSGGSLDISLPSRGAAILAP